MRSRWAQRPRPLPPPPFRSGYFPPKFYTNTRRQKMLRRFCMACLLLLGGWSSAVAQEPTRYVPQVGQVYQLREHILVALSPLYVEDLIKALRAKDMDGIGRMAEDGQV